MYNSYDPYRQPELGTFGKILIVVVLALGVAAIGGIAYFAEVVPNANVANFKADIAAKGFTVETAYLPESLVIVDLNSPDAFFQKAAELNTKTVYTHYRVFYLVNSAATFAWSYRP